MNVSRTSSVVHLVLLLPLEQNDLKLRLKRPFPSNINTTANGSHTAATTLTPPRPRTYHSDTPPQYPRSIPPADMRKLGGLLPVALRD